ncbi:hypothetical protein EYZ11_009086 [Aspergillus tanneri]|uniref:Uncharacterized protein n=1 Tax=Aspergillus tanneri TaxID=1220188 RepID=A0A4S3J8X0_9EURO|nr:uncharacterized protein ATNIH1004_009747 [Aspergillus tanneri]KAA8642985.1 hypothetical protein ATNIH1004_009747 [Aspergillus tanneri]THC91456.1 hypothetical protein EYZ11_009086 [Aspergillus tanneri]
MKFDEGHSPRDNKEYTGYVSRLKLKDSKSVEKSHIVGLAQAGWWEMYNKASKEDRVKFPKVMTALKVGDEVYLASSLKGGNYIYEGREGPREEKPNEKIGETHYGKFTTVLEENAPDVMNALDQCRQESIKTILKTTRALDKQGAGKDEWTVSRKKGVTSRGGGQWNSAVGGRRKGKPPGDTKPKTGNTLIQHKNDGACGEIMASLEYYLIDEQPSLTTLDVRPTVVAWSEDIEKTGKVKDNGNDGIKPPCDSTDPEKADKGCGEGWGCLAFTGTKGMKFEVIPKGTEPALLKEGDFDIVKAPTFPTPQKRTRNTQSNPEHRGPEQKGPEHKDPEQKGPEHKGPEQKGPEHKDPEQKGPEHQDPKQKPNKKPNKKPKKPKKTQIS